MKKYYDDIIRKSYGALNFEEHSMQTRARLSKFLKNSESKYLLMCEPVGFGKTSMLIQEALLPKNSETNEFRNVIFLTYSYTKAVEIHEKILSEIKDWEHKPVIARNFGTDFIKNEIYYRKSGDIKDCKKKEERKKVYTNERGSAWSICKKCSFNAKCPYYRSQFESKEGHVDILVGTLAELQSPGFYFNKASKFKDADFVVLDEDGVRKAVITKELDKKHLEFFINYIEVERNKVLSNEDVEKNERLEKVKFLDELNADIHAKIGILAWYKLPEQPGYDNESGDNSHMNSLSDRGLTADETKSEKFTSELSNLPKDEQQKIIIQLYQKWSNILDVAFRINSKINFSVKKSEFGEKMYLSIFPDLPFKKIIFTDATTVFQEVNSRFSSVGGGIEKTYDPQVDGVLIPKGKIYQVPENIPKTEYFNKGVIESDKLKELMKKLSMLAEDFKFRKGKTSIIAFSELVENKSFQLQCKKYGFICDPKMYHGGVRGLNSIESNDLIILGSNFPDDKQIKKDQFSQFDREVQYKYSDFYLQWMQNDDGDWYIDPHADMKNLGIQAWANRVGRDRGMYGRKIYLENILQSLRSRFYWHETKTLIFCPYPLTDFGIAVHEIVLGVVKPPTPEQIYLSMKNSKSIKSTFSLDEINQISNQKFQSLDQVARSFRDHGLPCSVDGDDFFLVKKELLVDPRISGEFTSKSKRKKS